MRPLPARAAVLRLVGLALVLLGVVGPAGAGPTDPDPSDEVFGAEARPFSVVLTLAESEVERLRAEPRQYARARLVEEGKAPYEDVAVKLKGAAGSFRPVDERPALTLKMDKLRAGQTFHGLDKWHLNNSVQDESLLHEALCADLMAAAGVPCARVSHARVRWNDRDLGLYVVKEAFDKRFLSRRFEKDGGNLYDGGFCQDVEAPLERDEGKGKVDRLDLAELAAASREPDLVAREKRLGARLDVEAFLTFVAMERMVGHWDGYGQNANNYRLHFRESDGRAEFFPHGMDQTFQDPEAPILDAPVALVADAVMAVPAWRKRYRERLVELLPLFDAERSLLPRLRRLVARLKPAVDAMGAGAAAAQAARVRDLEAALVARAESLREQVKRPDPLGVEFDKKGRAFVAGWKPVVEGGQPRLEQEDRAGRRAYGIDAGAGAAVASWRRRVVLAKGRYVLEGQVAVAGVVPRRDAEGTGAGLRVSGAVRKGGASGSGAFKATSFEFEVAEAQASVELVAELRADKGRAWFAVESLRLVRKP